ncbi:MAG: hypothetical protein IJX78_07230 [Bacilli bacterium]|nr:hypothetical protein [Bacilli bacterium]
MTNEEINRIRSLKTQNFVIFMLIIASSMSIYINNGQIDLIINQENSKYSEELLSKIAKISSIIFWLSAIYFTILNYNTYQKEKTKTNASFLLAAFLALQASSIRVFVLFNIDNSTNLSSEDIV